MYEMFLLWCFWAVITLVGALSVGVLFFIYKLTGGKRKFLSWFKAMKFNI